jgi:thioesterase domain-containing protein
VAFEMAQQLRAQGQEVALLALLDTYSAVVKKLPPLQRIGRLIMLLRIGRVDVFLQKISLFMLSGIEKLGRGIKQIRRSFYRGDNQAVPVHLQDFTYQMENDQALDLYTPQPYPGAITFFKSSDRLTYEFEPETANPEVGWRTLARGKMEVFDIPGDHLGMLEEPNVQVLGENLKACLAQVQVLDLK